jgi:hypothetical protein
MSALTEELSNLDKEIDEVEGETDTGPSGSGGKPGDSGPGGPDQPDPGDPPPAG